MINLLLAYFMPGPDKPNRPLRCVPIGDSFARRCYREKPDFYGWLTPLNEMTKGKFIQVGNLGVGGATTKEIATKVPELKAFAPDVVFLSLPTNDIGKTDDSIEEILERIAEIRDSILKLLPKVTLVLVIPPKRLNWVMENVNFVKAQNKRLEGVCRGMRRLTKPRVYIMDLEKKTNPKKHLHPDGIHLGILGEKQSGKVAYQTMKKAGLL